MLGCEQPVACQPTRKATNRDEPPACIVVPPQGFLAPNLRHSRTEKRVVTESTIRRTPYSLRGELLTVFPGKYLAIVIDAERTIDLLSLSGGEGSVGCRSGGGGGGRRRPGVLQLGSTGNGESSGRPASATGSACKTGRSRRWPPTTGTADSRDSGALGSPRADPLCARRA